MKTHIPSSRRRPNSKPEPAPATLAQQFEEMPDPLSIVEHLTIPGFIRRAPHRFHMEEITRFGDKVGRIAESLQVSYLTTIDRQLGQIRLFPVPLLERVYAVMAAQFGWEPLAEALKAIEDEALRTNERTRKRLQIVAETIENPAVAQAMATVLNWLENENTRMQAGEPAPAPAAPAVLRPVE